jgi:GNAT superfamily N-acetyltransferase
MRRALQRGRPLEAAAIVYRLARSGLLGQRGPVFRLTRSEADRLNEIHLLHYRITTYHKWEDIEEGVREELSRNDDVILWNAEDFLARGGQLWVGHVSAHLASVGWSWTSDKVRGYFFPLTASCVLLSHFVTLPAYRGRGFYVALLRHIARTLTAAGAECLFLHSADWNTASCRGISRAGFQPVGLGLDRRSGRLVWLQ